MPKTNGHPRIANFARWLALRDKIDRLKRLRQQARRNGETGRAAQLSFQLRRLSKRIQELEGDK